MAAPKPVMADESVRGPLHVAWALRGGMVMTSLPCFFCLSVAAPKPVMADGSVRGPLHVAWALPLHVLCHTIPQAVWV